jgi:hypothetical protein
VWGVWVYGVCGLCGLCGVYGVCGVCGVCAGVGVCACEGVLAVWGCGVTPYVQHSTDCTCCDFGHPRFLFYQTEISPISKMQ